MESERRKLAKNIFLIVLAITIVVTGTILFLTIKRETHVQIECYSNGKWTTVNFDNGATVASLKDPDDIVGYTFDAWYRDEQLSVPAISTDILSSKNKFYARFVPNKYKIQFHSNTNENLESTIDVIFDSQYSTLRANTFIKSHYNFVGWSLDSNANYTDDLIPANTSFTLKNAADQIDGVALHYFAIWKGEDLSVTLNLDDAVIPVGFEIGLISNTATYGESYVLPGVTQNQIDNISKTDDPLKKLRCFLIGEKEYNFGSTINNVVSDIEITLQWTDVDSIVQFNTNSISMEGVDNSYKGSFVALYKRQHSEKYTYTIPTSYIVSGLTNYRFVGWCENPSGNSTIYPAGSEFTTSKATTILYAIYQGNQINVTLDLSDANIPTNYEINLTSNTTTYGKNYTLPSVSDEQVANIRNKNNSDKKLVGFIIDGQYYNFGGRVSKVTKDIDIQLRWANREIICTLQFSTNLSKLDNVNYSGSTPADQVIKEFDQTSPYTFDLKNIDNAVLDDIIVDDSTYYFEGWSFSDDGSGTIYSTDNSVITTQLSDITLYAVWRVNVVIDLEGAIINDGSDIVLDVNYVYCGGSYVLPDENKIDKNNISKDSTSSAVLLGLLVNGEIYNFGATVTNVNKPLVIRLRWSE